MARPGIMLYFDILEPIRVLPDSDKGRLLVAMLEYGQDGMALRALLVCMAIDYASGWAVAAIFHKSPKTATGAYASNIGLKGLARKAMMFGIVCLGNMMDGLMGVAYLRDAIVIGFVVNESISIVENAGLMGLPLPKVVSQALDVLASKADTTE